MSYTTVPRRYPRVTVLALLVCVCAAVSAFAATAAVALTNPERHYELVSPLYKGGYGVGTLQAVALDGESVVFETTGVFGGLPWDTNVENDYLARRGATGWTTTPLNPPLGNADDFTPNLDYELGSRALGPNGGSKEYLGSEVELLLRATNMPDVAENWELYGGTILKSYDDNPPEPGELGASGNLCHIVLGKAAGPLLPGAAGFTGPLYDFSRGCGGEAPSLRLVGVRNKLGADREPAPINPNCSTQLGVGRDTFIAPEDAPEADFNAVADEGSELFFTTNVEKGNNCFQGVEQLFVRLGGSRTLEVSRPFEASKPFGGCVGEGVAGEVPCAGAASRGSAYFRGASEDGSRVFFMTDAPLVGGDTDSSSDLYMATIGCPESEPECEVSGRRVTSLTQVSHDRNPGEAADVQGVVRLAADGSRVYFVATGILGDGANGEGESPVAGADNLYVYDGSSGETTFITDLCSGPVASGGAQDVHCPTTLNNEVSGGRNDRALWEGSETQSTPDGRFLVFDSYGRLTRDDTDTASDVYRYDAETGALERVSVGEAGFDANGNRDENSDATINNVATGGVNPGGSSREQREMETRAISEDGSRIVFESAEPLSEHAINGFTNVYEWHKEPGWSEGRVSLISSGTSVVRDQGATISASGRDVFFQTSQGLVAQDTEGESDIYDARLGSGFPPSAAEGEPCAGDACQGPLTNPAPLLVAGSAVQAPGGNFAPSAPAVQARKAKPKKAKRGRPGSRRRRRKKGKASRVSGRITKRAVGGGGR